MSTAQTAPEHPPARAPRATDEDAPGAETLQHHARRVVVSELHAVERGILDPIISLLQRMRRGAGAADGAEEEDGGGHARSGRGKPGGGRDAGARAEADDEQEEAPKPKRRLLTFLIYFSALVAGGMIGGALSYELLFKLLDRQATESKRLEAAMAKLNKSTASNQNKLDEALAKRAEAEKKLEEAKKKQTEAEKKLETALNESKIAADKQKKLDDAVKLLEQIRGAERPGAAQRPPAAASAGSGAEGKARPLKSGDCTLAAGDVKSLKDCVKDFNR